MLKRMTTLVAAACFTLAVAAPVFAIDNDPWITMKTKVSLMTADGVGAIELNVDTVDGVVTLHGKVSTEGQKTRAENIAKGVKGVKDVRNLLQVVPKASRDVVNASDESIKDGIEAAFKANRRINDSGIKVASVNKGVVLLSGKTTSLQAELESVEVAYAVKGVKHVSTEVEVSESTN